MSRMKNMTFHMVQTTNLDSHSHISQRLGGNNSNSSRNRHLAGIRNRHAIAHLIGGLGNHLWIYASLYGIGMKTNRIPHACMDYNMSVLFAGFDDQVHAFKDCTQGKAAFYPNSTLHIGQRNHHLYYDTAIISTLKESNNPHAFVCCYLQNLGFFIEYTDELKKQFIIRTKYQVIAQQYLRGLGRQTANKTQVETSTNNESQISTNGNLPLYITVHVRRGNMLGEKNVKQPEPSYFIQAMEHFRNKYGTSVIFIVITDDMKWAKANITGENVYFTGDSGPKSREDDFAIAVACNHTIMSVGTFGWWMGFLTGGDVVYFKDWALGEWKGWLKHGQFFPHQWTAL